MNRHERRAAEARRSEAKTGLVFRLEKLAILRSLDVAALDAFFTKWKQPKPNADPLRLMHFARLMIPDVFTREEQMLSARWLRDNEHELPTGVRLISGDGNTMLVGAPAPLDKGLLT